jgi:hypothetical protein
MLKTFMLLILAIVFAPGCAGKRSPLESYAERQKTRMDEGTVYNQADFNFWAALYEPTQDDIEGLRNSWIEHGQAFPESKDIDLVEREVRKTSQRIVLVSVFMTSYEVADLKDKSLGWSMSPVPTKITELSENDVVLRTLMPVKNTWARYFMLTYNGGAWSAATELVVSNKEGRLNLRRH